MAPPSSSEPLNNNFVTRNVVSSASFVNSTSTLAEQFPEAKLDDIGPNSEQNMVDIKRQKRITSKRASSQRYRLRMKSFLADLENQFTTFKNQLAGLEQEEAFLQNGKQMKMAEEHALCVEIESLQKEILLKDENEKKREINKLRELQVKKDEQVESWLLNGKQA
ncbi:hypothetical protein Fmac_014211 [Flemingia macrophylla]|uniref:BZIP transcription factor n=1 Tax=Flemingia macrophylla TaxID=520843 RepID=A0ABD1MB22_9FABA